MLLLYKDLKIKNYDFQSDSKQSQSNLQSIIDFRTLSFMRAVQAVVFFGEVEVFLDVSYCIIEVFHDVLYRINYVYS